MNLQYAIELYRLYFLIIFVPYRELGQDHSRKHQTAADHPVGVNGILAHQNGKDKGKYCLHAHDQRSSGGLHVLLSHDLQGIGGAHGEKTRMCQRDGTGLDAVPGGMLCK